jgi:hypothetical protein
MIKTPNLPIKHIRAEFKAAKEKGDLKRMEEMFFAFMWQYNKLKKIHAQRISRVEAKITGVEGK